MWLPNVVHVCSNLSLRFELSLLHLYGPQVDSVVGDSKIEDLHL
jgi:hypothetical protein